MRGEKCGLKRVLSVKKLGDKANQIGDLFEMDFRADMSLDEYNREMNVYGNRPDLPVPPDVQAEHAKIEKADGLVFIFPVRHKNLAQAYQLGKEF